MSATRTLSFHARLSKERLMLIWLSWQLAIAGALHEGYMVRFKKIGSDSRHVSDTLFELEGHDRPQCAMACINTKTCVSFSVAVSPDVPGSSCRLSRSSAGVTDLESESGWSYFVMVPNGNYNVSGTGTPCSDQPCYNVGDVSPGPTARTFCQCEPGNVNVQMECDSPKVWCPSRSACVPEDSNGHGEC